MSEPKKLAIAVLIDTLMDKHEAEVAALKAEVQRLEGNILGWKGTVMAQDSIVKCRDEEIERLRNELTNRSEAIRELIDERADNRWRPIETAPMDGKTVVLVVDCGYVFIGIFDKNGYCQDLYNAGLNPTHWMPLPQPPTK